MAEIRTRPMTSEEFEELRPRLIREYAAAQVEVGDWAADTAEERAAEQTDQLLPNGVASQGVSILVGETPDGDVIGYVWVALEHQPGSGRAWIYDIETRPQHRGQGYGRALLLAAEEVAARNGLTSIGLNVFGGNRVARDLYESNGYTIGSMHMHKTLSAPGDRTLAY